MSDMSSTRTCRPTTGTPPPRPLSASVATAPTMTDRCWHAWSSYDDDGTVP